MSGDVRRAEDTPARRPGRTRAAVAVLLLLGGGTAMAVGLAGQDPDPPAPSAEAAAGSSPATSAAGAVPAPPQTVAPAPAPAPAPAALPVSLDIPAIGVASALITVGLDPDGTLEVPQPGPDYDEAAWYDASPRPGDIGPAVIEGHVDSKQDGPSVFYRLGALAAGDEVRVTREDGSVVTFVVDAVRAFPKDDFPTLDVYGSTDGPELRLITCAGLFDSRAGHYVDNTVVFAHQVLAE